jgi:hypothetical protein
MSTFGACFLRFVLDLHMLGICLYIPFIPMNHFERKKKKPGLLIHGQLSYKYFEREEYPPGPSQNQGGGGGENVNTHTPSVISCLTGTCSPSHFIPLFALFVYFLPSHCRCCLVFLR